MTQLVKAPGRTHTVWDMSRKKNDAWGMKNLNKTLFNADQICLPYCLYFFLTSSKYLMMKDARRQKSIAKFICSVTPFFVFVFVIYNLIPHRGPLSRGCIYQGILSHWEYCFFPYTGYHWDLETHIAGKNSGEVWGHLDFWIIDSTELVLVMLTVQVDVCVTS